MASKQTRILQKGLREPGNYLTFPCVLTAVMLQNRHLTDMIMQPARTRVDGHRVWILVLCGFLFYFFVSKQKPPPQFSGAFLRENGVMLLNVSDIHSIPSLRNWMIEIAAAEKLRTARREE